VHARPSADVPGARIRRPAAAVPDDAGQHVADAEPAPSEKHATVTRLKRSGLDLTDIANFRPVSNLRPTFMSKIVERAAASQRTERSTRPKQPCYTRLV